MPTKRAWFSSREPITVHTDAECPRLETIDDKYETETRIEVDNSGVPTIPTGMKQCEVCDNPLEKARFLMDSK